LGHSVESSGICFIQYQQNFFPGSGAIGEGSVRRNPAATMIAPAMAIGNPKIETPIGTYKSSATRKTPKTAKIVPEASKPLYI